VTLDVIAPGFARTGTMSMRRALERLGHAPCHHMESLFRDGRQARLWQRIARGATPDWHRVFAGYRACTDMPSVFYAEPILRAFPEARVVLTRRDPDAWYESMRETAWAIRCETPAWLRDPVPRLGRSFEVMERAAWQGFFEGRFEDPAFAKAKLIEHEARVAALVPPERLLVMGVDEGWAPLCAFLGHPVPDEPFPDANERAVFGRRLRLVRAARRGVPFAAGALGLAGLAALAS
jgi:hypothetical protein